MYFSKIVKKCNTGSAVYNSIDYFPNGVRSFFSSFVFNDFPETCSLFVSIVKSLTVILTFMTMYINEKHGIHKSRANYYDCK